MPIEISVSVSFSKMILNMEGFANGPFTGLYPVSGITTTVVYRWLPPSAPAATNTIQPTASATKSITCVAIEDCLFLDVTVPAAATSGSKLPVVVFIHGGGYSK
jgi:acetyl esterase/lipase